jgi:hypothetical protein
MASATPDAGRADRQVGLVVGVGGGQQALAQVGLALVVALDHGDLLAVHLHGAAGGVFQAHHQAGLGLLAIGLQRAGLAVDMGDLDVAGGEGRGTGQHGQRGEGDEGAALHEVLLWT